MRIFWKTVALVGCGLILLLLWSGSMSLAAKAPASEVALKIDGHAAILIEPASGEVLYQQNQDQKLPPASVTKLMVMLLTLEALEKGQLKLTDPVTASAEACKMGGSQIWLEPGETMTVAELMKAVCIVSANDASYALGEHLAGSEENFIALMNKRSRELGLKTTHYVNCTGLDPSDGGEGNYTSAADMGLLAREVVKHPLVFKWSGVWIDSLRGGKSFLRNTNNLVRFYRGCDGLKTGFTAQAGFCLVATAMRDGVRLIAVVMNSPTSKTRAKDISSMLNYGFSKYKAYQVCHKGEAVGRVRVFRGKQTYLNPVVAKDLVAVLKRDHSGKINKQVHLDPVVKAPVKAGEKLGWVSLSCQGKTCGSADLIAPRSVPKASFFALMGQIFQGMLRMAVN